MSDQEQRMGELLSRVVLSITGYRNYSTTVSMNTKSKELVAVVEIIDKLQNIPQKFSLRYKPIAGQYRVEFSLNNGARFFNSFESPYVAQAYLMLGDLLKRERDIIRVINGFEWDTTEAAEEVIVKEKPVEGSTTIEPILQVGQRFTIYRGGEVYSGEATIYRVSDNKVYLSNFNQPRKQLEKFVYINEKEEFINKIISGIYKELI